MFLSKDKFGDCEWMNFGGFEIKFVLFVYFKRFEGES